MRTSLGERTLLLVEGTTAHLLLKIEAGSDPIAGSIGTADAEPRRFSGWIELTEAIEAARGQSLGSLPRAKGAQRP